MISPFENDTALSALFGEYSKQASYRKSAINALETRDRNHSLRYAPGSYNYDRLCEQRDKAASRMAELEAEMAPYEAEFAARRWSRFFLVTNGNGHVHSSMSCSTCYQTTEFAWLPELAGKTEAEMVEEFGEKACTVCFPSAPANPSFRGPGRRDRATLDAKAAEKASKAAAKLEKALLPDGSPLRLSDFGTPTTLIAGQRALSSTLQSMYTYNVMYAEVHGRTEPHPHTPKWEADVALLVEAISNKTGQPADEVLAEAQAKAEKKVRKEWA